MADVATPPAAEGKQQVVKPEKPDEDKYKEDLAKAEKEHTAAQDKLVGALFNPPPAPPPVSFHVQDDPATASPVGYPHGTRWSCAAASANGSRTRAKPSSTSRAQTTKTRPTRGASKSSRRSSMPFARHSRATSRGAMRYTSRSRSTTSNSSRGLTSSRLARARSTTSRSKRSTRKLRASRSRSTAA